MAAPVRTKIDLSQPAGRPVLRLVPPLPEVEEKPREEKAAPRVTEPKAPRKRRPSHRRVAACTPAIRRRRRVAASILVGLGMFLTVFGVGSLVDVFTSNVVPERTAVVWVQPGESLWDVAERSAPGYNPEAVVARIHELNEISGAGVLAGQALQVPSAP
ncbi:LysM peptidoglycan-binding domain-containing protein [Kibdelosporangium persicum]|uniref:Peptidoglycan-binding LysM n=1 Tax=Kibdelosporangium persicum TaxID=2698649 RepID=A0ABX2F9T3_9PSEU|nr:LysM peptidoglycan-binding domain-containing protein [Kibdelosporangium persicum]NRN68082.1 Peptidoglycan-binding LysM [Kibdelosporangium persicum]